MISAEESKLEVKHLLKKELPKARISRVDVKNTADAEGQPSLNIWIVFEIKPAKADLKKTDAIVDEFRTWLTEMGDDRFPYFNFLTLKDEKELSE